MQDDPRYDDVVSEVARFLEERLAFAVAAGIPEERICLDPGHRVRQDGRAQRRAARAARRDRRARPPARRRARRASGSSAGCSGTRRRPPGRSPPGIAAALAAFERGATILRVHEVAPHVEALAVARAVEECGHERRDDRAARPRAPGVPRRHRGGAPRRPDVPLRRRARRELAAARRRTPWRTRSTTARSSRSCARCRTAARSTLLEALAAGVADALLERFPVSRVRVRVRKPDVRLEAPVEHAAVTVERTRADVGEKSKSRRRAARRGTSRRSPSQQL